MLDPLSLGVTALMSLGGAGLNYLGQQGNEAGRAQPGGHQYLPYPIRPEYQQAGEFFSNAMQRTEQGRAPVWFERFKPIAEQQTFNDIYSKYYGGDVTGVGGAPGSFLGRRFTPGSLRTQQSADIAAGRRGDPGARNIAAQVEQYNRELWDARQLMQQLEAQTIGQAGTGAAQQLAQMYQPNTMGQYVQYQGRPYQPSGLEQFGTAISGLAPYASFLNFGSNPTPTPMPTPDLSNPFQPGAFQITPQDFQNYMYGGY